MRRIEEDNLDFAVVMIISAWALFVVAIIFEVPLP